MAENILKEARDIMRRDGVGALNLNEIAIRVGMKTPSLYKYFSGKMALYDALFLEGVRLYNQLVVQPQQSIVNFGDWLEFGIYHHLNFAYLHPDLHFLIFERPVPHFIPSQESMAEIGAALANLTHKIEEFINNGQLVTNLSLETVRDVFIVNLHGMTSLHLANEPDLPPGQGRFGSLIPVITALLKEAWQRNPT